MVRLIFIQLYKLKMNFAPACMCMQVLTVLLLFTAFQDTPVVDEELQSIYQRPMCSTKWELVK